jgi:hypothetical protein
MSWELDEKGQCKHFARPTDRKFLGRVSGWEVYQCQTCGYITLGVGIPLKHFLDQDKLTVPVKLEKADER